MKIQEFSFGNFKSFKDIQTLNLSAAKITSKNKDIDENNVIENGKISFLKSKAVYGANASGKSNIAKALVAFIRVVNTSLKDEKVLENYIDKFRLSIETESEPSFFQMIFWLDSIKYRYGFEANEEKITSEWLYGTPKSRELPYFIRENQEIIELDKTNYSEGNKFLSLLEGDEAFRNNSLFLTTLGNFGFGKLSKKIVDNISKINIISGLKDFGLLNLAKDSLSNKNEKEYILNFLKMGDIGIENLDAIEFSSDDLPNDIDEDTRSNFDTQKVLFSVRKKYDENYNLQGIEPFIFDKNESEGTQKLFELSPFIYTALKSENPIIVDEFDARFHPLLTRKIVELFNSKANKGAQLIFMTHDTNLLSSDLLRRDQIEFVEKDKFGESHLYSLIEFKGIRNNASFEKDYIQGKYGAIPFLGDFSKLIYTEEDA